MGLTNSEKAKLATYQLKDVAQTWYIQCTNIRPLRDGPMTWDIFSKDFLDRFFPRERGKLRCKNPSTLAKKG